MDRLNEKPKNLLRSSLPLSAFSPTSSPTGLCGANNKLSTNAVCCRGLISLCSKLLLHTISLPIDLQELWGRSVAKVWRCGTSSGNRPQPNCLCFVSWSYWQLPLSQPSWLQRNEQEPANCNGLFIISDQTLSYGPEEAASFQTISEAL